MIFLALKELTDKKGTIDTPFIDDVIFYIKLRMGNLVTKNPGWLAALMIDAESKTYLYQKLRAGIGCFLVENPEDIEKMKQDGK